MIYTVSAIVGDCLFKEDNKKHVFVPQDKAALKQLYLLLKNSMKKLIMPVRNQGKALPQFAGLYDGRMPVG